MVVVTDRVVLDRQLQDTIHQFDHRQGVVEKIEENSRQLAEALENVVPIIITTLQKFPFVSQHLGVRRHVAALPLGDMSPKAESSDMSEHSKSHLPTRKCAVIIDEAHSSQSGETATDLKEVLGGEALRKKAKELAEEEGGSDLEKLYRNMAKRGRQPNLSFFSFTATPKHKTLKVFAQSPNDHKAMNAVLDKASTRFEEFQKGSEEEAELWRGNLHAFRNLYAFLSQVIPYQDSDLEKLYAYLKHLALKLPKRKTGPGYQFDDEVQLEYYRLQKISEGTISLSEGTAKPLDGPKEVGTGIVREEQVPLSRLIDLINERFGENLSEADQLFFDQITEAASQVDAIRQAAENNPIGKFQLVFGEVLESLFIERMDLNEELFARYMNDPEFKAVAAEWLGQQVYSKVPKTSKYL